MRTVGNVVKLLVSQTPSLSDRIYEDYISAMGRERRLTLQACLTLADALTGQEDDLELLPAIKSRLVTRGRARSIRRRLEDRAAELDMRSLTR